MDFNEWLSSLPGAPTPTVAGKQAGIVSTTVLRHAAKGETTADIIISIARAYDVPVIEALVNTGHLKPGEATDDRLALRMALKGASVTELWDALAEKVDGSRLFIEHLPRFHDLQMGVGEPNHDGTVGEFAFSPEQYAADSSEDVTEMRLERGEDPID